MKRKYLYIAPLLAFLAAGCEPSIKDEIDSGTYYPGEADFSSYVAIGNSLTAGYMDGTLYRSGQKNSFPNILAQQFKIVGGGEFTQPPLDDDTNDVGGMLMAGNPLPGFDTKLVMNMSTSSPENKKGTITLDVNKRSQKAYHNAGVPGAKTFHLIAPGYGSMSNLLVGKANPYFVRTATSDETTVMADVMTLKPTFFTNWIGANDVLAYATSGGEGVDQNEQANGTDLTQYGGNDITHIGVFKMAYEGIVNTLTSGGAKGVVATVPDVTTIPYFTTVPYNPITAAAVVQPGQNPDEVFGQLNMLVGMFKGILEQFGQGDRLQLLDKDKANPLLIQDKTLDNLEAQIAGTIKALVASGKFPFPITDPEIAFIAKSFGQARHATAKDLMLLTSRAQIGASFNTGNPTMDAMLKKGITFPIDDKFVLNEVEQQKVQAATNAFNSIIKNVANEKGLAVADMNDLLRKAVSGLKVEDGQIYTADYFKGMGNLNTVMFSLDGVHLNPRGYAFIAAEILRVINKHYKANIPLVNPAVYPGPTLVLQN
ncbi:hypothetical protein HX004_05105 [Myroides sp. 1354]|uniref:hypothetical protein n=1 Tax=unclassified Myroides TaxID=2642485 RepID=UPI002576996F|nr:MULTISPECIES: hypothetical protein [unclassified Myroides]MDM1044215.1 hypothetical protein [Myroides sp. R163-1]MDM1055151.1 hypothetical protein [Myroides sp. 1354]MDM1068448.1 hypothetical protein [Myroides sp. 1372]